MKANMIIALTISLLTGLSLGGLPSSSCAEVLSGQSQGDWLKVDVQELRGVQPTTKNNLYVKVKVVRDGQDFSVFCRRKLSLSANGSEADLICPLVSNSVSGDDDESLVFTVAMIHNTGSNHRFALKDVDYVGDGTAFGREMTILAGKNWRINKIWKTAQVWLDSPVLVPQAFKVSETVINALENLIGEKVETDVLGGTAMLPILGFYASISEALNVNISTALDTSSLNGPIRDPENIELSLLNQAGDLDSGFRTDLEQEVRERLEH